MLTPTQDYILVRPVQRVRSETLLIITAETDQGSDGAYGDVIAVGPGKPNKKGNVMPLDAKPGDRVMFGGQGLGCIKFPKFEDCILIQEADICFVEEPEIVE